MPELPEVETVVRGLRPHLTGRKFVHVEQRRPDLREKLPAGLARRLLGRQIAAVDRRAKYILILLDDGNVLVVHLGMSGQFVLGEKPNAVGLHEHLAFTLDDGRVLRFTDPRRFGLMDLVPLARLAGHRRFAEIGPEPLSPDFTAGALAELLDGRRGPIKAALIDQRVVAGVGNIYACEALYAAGISPKRKSHTVVRDRASRLVAALKDVLEKAIAAGGSSARDYVNASGDQGWFQAQWAVYDREGQPCPACDCGGGVRRIVQSGRSTFYCARRQR
ncbi:MAG TPA: bifunctional DNA-formamidopyrimidine glycosylase/DNA-(apurinic or apyrimidinic site) lyase [Alphaproteobacteria bacterium]